MGTFSKHSHRKLYFKGTKSFTETLDASKTEAEKYLFILILHSHLTLYTRIPLNGQTH